jgi:hypothetical protein
MSLYIIRDTPGKINKTRVAFFALLTTVFMIGFYSAIANSSTFFAVVTGLAAIYTCCKFAVAARL